MTTKTRVVALAFLLASLGVVARAADDGGYPLAVIAGESVHTVEAGSGLIIVRRWDGTRGTFSEVLRQKQIDLVGDAIAIALGHDDRIAFLTTARYQEYELWDLDLVTKPLRARRIWRKKLDASLYEIDASPSGYVISGDNDVVHVEETTECVHHVSDRFAAAEVDDKRVLLADSGGLSSLSIASCNATAAVRQLSLRGQGVDVAHAIGGTVAIVRSGRRTMLMLLDEKFHPVGVLRLDGRRSWRLSSVGRFILASAPESKYAFQIHGGSVHRLTLSRVLNGYVSASRTDAPILATDGSRLAGVRSAQAVRWRTPYNLRGVYVDWLDLAIYAAGTLVVVTIAIIGLRQVFPRQRRRAR